MEPACAITSPRPKPYRAMVFSGATEIPTAELKFYYIWPPTTKSILSSPVVRRYVRISRVMRIQCFSSFFALHPRAPWRLYRLLIYQSGTRIGPCISVHGFRILGDCLSLQSSSDVAKSNCYIVYRIYIKFNKNESIQTKKNTRLTRNI